MVSGYNHNVKYQDDVFHVQTEDSGLQNPRIVTHVFLGGTIVATDKINYAEALEREDLRVHVTGLMQRQHKSVLKGLIHGHYDSNIALLRSHVTTLSGPAPLPNGFGQGQGQSSGGQQVDAPAAPLPDTAPEGQAPSATPPPSIIAADPARPPFGAPPPSNSYLSAPAAEQAAAQPPMPPEEQSYPEAQLVEADDQSMDSLFGSLSRERTLDEVILAFLGHNNPKP